MNKWGLKCQAQIAEEKQSSEGNEPGVEQEGPAEAKSVRTLPRPRQPLRQHEVTKLSCTTWDLFKLKCFVRSPADKRITLSGNRRRNTAKAAPWPLLPSRGICTTRGLDGVSLFNVRLSENENHLTRTLVTCPSLQGSTRARLPQDGSAPAVSGKSPAGPLSRVPCLPAHQRRKRDLCPEVSKSYESL